MYRQSPSRNQRSKGIRVKHVLQICLLLAVCFWLIYQVKHSHDKRKEFNESDGRGLLQRESGDDLIKLGRKDVQARSGGTFYKNEKHEELEEEEEEEEEATGEEVKENKSEEDEAEDKKIEGNEDEAMEGGEDEVDGHELEKPDEEVDREDDLVDEEKEREDGIENDTQETDSEDPPHRVEKDIASQDSDHDGDDRSIDEAREEHYKADDVSSATTENENEHLENSKENPHNILEYGKKENKSEVEERKDLEVEGGEIVRDVHQSNTTARETKDGMLDNSDNSSSRNDTATKGFDTQLTNNSTSEVTAENHDSPSQHVTDVKHELEHNLETLSNDTSGEGSNFKIMDSNQANDSIVNADINHVGSNSTDSTRLKHAEVHSESSNSSIYNTETITSEASVEAGTDGSSPEKNYETKFGNSDVNDGTDDTMESTTAENQVDDLPDTIDISDTSSSLEENDVHTDLDTLPELQTEGTNSKDVAAE